MKRYYITGRHPESDSEWIEEETFYTPEEAFSHIETLLNDGSVIYSVIDRQTGKEVFLSTK